MQEFKTEYTEKYSCIVKSSKDVYMYHAYTKASTIVLNSHLYKNMHCKP